MTTSNKKNALGKGIRSLLQNIDADLKTTAGNLQSTVVQAVTGISRIPISKIEINPKQPRKTFNEKALQELAASIKIHDIIQPITVAALSNGRYQLISGERRWRASSIAGLKDIPAYIRKANDQELLELALLENLQREDLDAMEIALSYKRLMDELHLTQEQVAERMSKERSTVTNYIRLLKLPPNIQIAVRDGSISMGHARALINIEVIDRQLFVFNEITKKSLSVRQTENLVRTINHKNKTVKKSIKSSIPPIYKRIEDNLASHFGTKVHLNHSKNGKGNITLEYYSVQELNKILELMKVQIS